MNGNFPAQHPPQPASLDRARRAFAFGAGLLSLSLIARPAPAEATRPLFEPPQTIKILRLAQPVSLPEAMAHDVTGLDLETAQVQQKILAQAHDYITYRSELHHKGAVKWLQKCGILGTDLTQTSAAAKSEAAENPFCGIEKQRLPTSISLRSSSEARIANREIAELIRAGHYDKLGDRSDHEVTTAVSAMGEAATLIPIAKKIAEQTDCVPSSLASALGGKLEDLFPAQDAVELSKSLYKKANFCGKNLSAAKAAFRLGLILVWQKQYADVPDLMAKVQSIPEASQFHARARYWRYRCASMAGNDVETHLEQEELARAYPLSFQNLAANGDNDGVMEKLLGSDDPKVAMRSVVRSDLNPVLRSAEALAKAGSPILAADVLDHYSNELASMEPEARLYTAVFLNRIGYALARFKILSALFQDVPRTTSLATMKMMFPLGYLDIIKKKSAEIDPFLILSLIRQESAFNAVARSQVGARGLMQVMPRTARNIASVRTKQLFEPATNVRVGTKYFLQRLKQYDGDVELTLAAYNAGISRVDAWLKRYPTDDKILFLDFIPFKETRDYVSSILRNYYWYTRLYSKEVDAATTEPGRLKNEGAKIQAIMSAHAGLAARPGLAVVSPASNDR